MEKPSPLRFPSRNTFEREQSANTSALCTADPWLELSLYSIEIPASRWNEKSMKKESFEDGGSPRRRKRSLRRREILRGFLFLLFLQGFLLLRESFSGEFFFLRGILSSSKNSSFFVAFVWYMNL